MKRRDFFKQVGIGSATLVSFPALTHALATPSLARSLRDSHGQVANTFSILLSGTYKPVKHGPALGLSGINLSDGSYSTTKIFPVSGLRDEDSGHDDRGNRRSDSQPGLIKSEGRGYTNDIVRRPEWKGGAQK